MKTGGLLCALAAAALASLAACGGDETTATTTTATTSSTTSGSGATTSGGSGGGGTSGAGAGGAALGAEAVVFNEINALSPNVGDVEWFEIVNTGDTAFNLNGYGLTDADSVNPMNPDLSEVTRFPVDAVIPAGGYFLILLDQDQASNPPMKHVDCVMGAPAGTVCYDAQWKISASNGERIFFVAPNNDVIATADYPDPTVVIPSPVAPQTWARIPDRTGDFAIGAATPGAANMAPP